MKENKVELFTLCFIDKHILLCLCHVINCRSNELIFIIDPCRSSHVKEKLSSNKNR